MWNTSHTSIGTLFVGFATLFIICLWRYHKKFATASRIRIAESSDPSLLKKHTTYESYSTPCGFVYPRIRTFYKAHQQAQQLPNDLPLLVFTHGLGGNASQFGPLLTSCINLAPCLAIDFPGCGLSDFAPQEAKAYSTNALAELLATAIAKFRDNENNQKIVLMGHSMGCSINVLLASTSSPSTHSVRDHIVGMVSICPRASEPSKQEKAAVRRLAWMPASVFDLFRRYDRRGGVDSRSVKRIVGKDAKPELRKLQLLFNQQTQSDVFLRMVVEVARSQLMLAQRIWENVKVPLFLVGGEADNITPAAEIEQIARWLTFPSEEEESHVPQHSKPRAVYLPTSAGDAATVEESMQPDDIHKPEMRPRTDSGGIIQDDQRKTKHSVPLKTTIFPPPAGHGLMYSSSTVRILSGMMESFFSSHIDERLGIGWQMHHLTTSGKWDVKNLKKWQNVDPCSEPMGGIFRAMKTMREVDEEHCPREFAKRYGSRTLADGVAIVLDISHETPVYDSKGLEEGGVEYHKFPTVSKEKPKAEEADSFVALVDELRQSPAMQPSGKEDSNVKPTIAVHCHYGFNRTGFFIACYLVEREGWKVQDAVAEFAKKRKPGIKHEHFIDELYVRYAVKMPASAAEQRDQ